MCTMLAQTPRPSQNQQNGRSASNPSSHYLSTLAASLRSFSNPKPPSTIDPPTFTIAMSGSESDGVAWRRRRRTTRISPPVVTPCTTPEFYNAG